jgi:hypothetical protein
MGSNRTGASDKFTKNRVNKLRRSTLIVPGNMEKYLSKAFERGADAVQLDLEDSISREHKAEARNMVASLLQSQLATEAEINVRINHDELFWSKDLEAVVLPRLNSLTLPKCEDPEWIFLVDQQISKLEKERDIAEGSIELSVLIESAKGLHSIDKLLDASPRISTVTLGRKRRFLLRPRHRAFEPRRRANNVLRSGNSKCKSPRGHAAWHGFFHFQLSRFGTLSNACYEKQTAWIYGQLMYSSCANSYTQ